MRNIAIFACVILVFGVTVQQLDADEMPNLSDPKIIDGRSCAPSWKSSARIATARMAPDGVNLTRRVLDAKGVFISIADGREKNGVRMPAWREVLTDQEIWDAAAYVLSISRPTH